MMWSNLLHWERLDTLAVSITINRKASPALVFACLDTFESQEATQCNVPGPDSTAVTLLRHALTKFSQADVIRFDLI